jgi:hypothetical protein
VGDVIADECEHKFTIPTGEASEECPERVPFYGYLRKKCPIPVGVARETHRRIVCSIETRWVDSLALKKKLVS